jgi:MFS family permease
MSSQKPSKRLLAANAKYNEKFGAKKPGNYKWIALSNTTLGVLMASITGNIMLISLPAIFRGVNVDPLSTSGANYMLWMLMGFNVVTATLLVTFGRLSDMYGRVKLYNLGFAIFTIASIALFFTPSNVVFMIVMRMVQGIGAGFLFSNSMAIITDAFGPKERGMAMGLNQISSVGGNLIGLILGGLLSAIDWRLVFLVNVPVGLFGTVWAYLKLKEQTQPDKSKKIDWWGNITFAAGLVLILIAFTIGIMPTKTSVMGWGSFKLWALMIPGIILMIAFVFIELRVKSPMFHLQLFKIRAFAAGNISLFLSSIARGGLNFILIIWLQGIWLPLHGYNFEETPLWAGIYMFPMMAGFFIMGPLCGKLSDRYGAREFATGGMALSTIGFVLLNFLPVNFNYIWLFFILIVLGLGMGMFAAPNTSAVMNSVPAEFRGVASGMRSTFQNTGTSLSMAFYFTIIIAGLSTKLPATLSSGLLHAGVPEKIAQKISEMPPTSALFAAFLGYNPMQQMVPASIMHTLPKATQTLLVSKTFFPNVIAPAVMSSLQLAFWISAAISLIAAVVSLFRGKQFIYEDK